MKKYLITGFLALLPIALTIAILKWVLDFFTEPFVSLLRPFLKHFEEVQGPLFLNHDSIVIFLTRILVLILLLVFAIGLGFFGQKFLKGALERLFNPLFLRIPFVKSVYGMSKDITKAV